MLLSHFFSNIIWKKLTYEYKTYKFNIKVRHSSEYLFRFENLVELPHEARTLQPPGGAEQKFRQSRHGIRAAVLGCTVLSSPLLHTCMVTYITKHEAQSTSELPGMHFFSWSTETEYHLYHLFHSNFPEVVPTSTSSSFLSSKEGSLQEQPLHFKSLWIIGIIKMNLEFSLKSYLKYQNQAAHHLNLVHLVPRPTGVPCASRFCVIRCPYDQKVTCFRKLARFRAVTVGRFYPCCLLVIEILETCIDHFLTFKSLSCIILYLS